MQPSYLKLEPGEEIILVRRRHIINVVPFFAAVGFLLLITFFGIPFLIVSQDSLLFPVPVGAIISILTVLDTLALVIALAAYLIYLQTKVVLTNQHYIQINQNGIFGRTVSKMKLDEIADARGTRRGVLPTLLNYGELLIETAGKEENFFIKPIGDPLNLAEEINDAHENFERAHTFERP